MDKKIIFGKHIDAYRTIAGEVYFKKACAPFKGKCAIDNKTAEAIEPHTAGPKGWNTV